MYSIKKVTKYYDDKLIIDDLSLNIKKNAVNAIIGRSGTGKTTLLNILSGSDKNYTGDIADFANKKISFVFQEDRLIENLSVYENLKLVLEDDKNAGQIIENALLKCKMHEFIDYYPSFLSGGMRQRINIVRAFIVKPEIIFLDEPFKSIDILLKEDIKRFFLSLHKEEKSTLILVDHDINSVLDVSDNIAVLSDNCFRLKKYYENIQDSDREKIKEEIRVLM